MLCALGLRLRRSSQSLPSPWCSLGFRNHERPGFLHQVDIQARNELSIFCHERKKFITDIIGVILLTAPLATKTKDGWSLRPMAVVTSKGLWPMETILPVHEEVFTDIGVVALGNLIHEDDLARVPVAKSLRNHFTCPGRIRNDRIGEALQELNADGR